jgi:hypothetical protein
MVEITDIKKFKKNVMNKLSGYRKVDKVKLACNPKLNKNKKIITYDACLKLVQQLDSVVCSVCEDTMLFQDYIPWCMYQFSFDRLDNRIIHSIDNIRIICWGCNSYPNQPKKCSRCNHSQNSPIQ